MKHLTLLKKRGSKQAKPVTTKNRTETDQAKSSTNLLIVYRFSFINK